MEWFRHDSNANLDEKLQEVLLDYGLEGYGLYWYCIELIVGKTSADNITFEIKHDARIIARNTGSTPQRVEEMMKRFISVGLFENTNGKITCLKVAKRLMSSATSNPQMRNIIHNIKQHHDPVMTQSNIVMKDKIRLDNIDNIDAVVGSKVIELKIANPPPPTEFTYSSQKFSMYGEWTPSDSFETLAKIAGMKLGDDYPVDEFLEFRTYWVTQPAMQRTQGEWEHSFIKSYKIKQMKGAKK
jgi:hypothetical protein